MSKRTIRNIHDSDRLTVTELRGIDCTGIGESGALHDCLNVVASESGGLRPRGRRAYIRSFTSGNGLHGDDTLAYVDSGTLYYGGLAVSSLHLTSGDKRIHKVGRKLCIFPDSVYYDTATGKTGSLGARVTLANAAVCAVDLNGNEISFRYGDIEPDNASEGDYICVRKNDGTYQMKRCEDGIWTECGSALKLKASGIGEPFLVGDTLLVHGGERLGGSITVTACEANALYFDGILPSELEFSELVISRPVPDFDFTCESGGRLWGARRGREYPGGETVCKIYASAVGKPTVFLSEGGGAERSVDISGVFTGMCDKNGSAVIFSETEIIEAEVRNGDIVMSSVKSYGLEKGAEKSLALYGRVLYYKSHAGVCAYDGSYPERVSFGLPNGIGAGEHGSPAAALDGKIYMKLTDIDSKQAIFVYDTVKKTWFRYNDCGAKFMAVRGHCLYIQTADKLLLCDYDERSESEKSYLAASGYPLPESAPAWYAECGELGTRDLLSRIPTRLVLRLKKPEGGTVRVGIIYDGEAFGSETVITEGTGGAVNLPIPLARCDTFRFRISGDGECELGAFRLDTRKRGEARGWK